MIIEILVARRILFRENLPDISEEDKSKENCRFSLQDKAIFQSRQSTAQLAILIIVPFLILFFIGNSIISIHRHKESKSIFLALYKNSSSAGESIVIEGRVSDHPIYRYGKINFLFTAYKIYSSTGNGNLNIFFNTGEIINVKLDSTNTDWILRDDYLRLAGNLEKNNSNYITAGRYDEIIFKAGHEDIKKIERSNLSYTIFSFRSRLYSCLRNAFYRNLENEDACIAEAVILGGRNNVPDYLTEAFKRCGLYHLFAISGMQLSFFVSLIYLIFKKIKSSNSIFWATVIFLITYNFLVGERASMLRALIMAIFILLARRWNREYSYKILLYLSYIIMIIYNPYFLYDLGFWMTYASMAALVFIYPLVLKPFKNIFISLNPGIKYFIKIALISLSIQIVLFPVSAYFFKEVSLISPVANMLIIPAFYILLSILMVSSFLIIIWPPVGGIILKSVSIFFEYILKTVKILSKLDFCIINFDSFTAKNVIVYYVVLLIIFLAACMINKRISINKGNRKESNIPQ